MSQLAWTILISEAGTAIFEKSIDNFAALTSCYSGATPPIDPAPVAGQLFFKTTTKELHQYDGSAWVVIATALAGATPNMDEPSLLPSITATSTIPLAVLDADATVESLEIVTETTTFSDATDHWTIQLHNATQAEDLFAAAFDTDATDFAAGTPITIPVDQNEEVAAGDYLRVVFTKFNSATNFGWTRIILRMVPR